MTVLAVDGGQSAIRLRHSSSDRSVEVEGVSRLEGDLVTGTAEAIVEVWRRAGSPQVDRAVLGLTTAPPDAERAEALCALIGEAIGASEVWVADDSVTSHYGALSGTPGVALIAGTGVACLALPRAGQPRLFDGNGYLLGDEGGAFWIGASAIRSVLRRHDGVGAATALSHVAAERFGPIPELREAVYGHVRPVNAVAQFARDVLDVAGQGDSTAEAIVQSAADELAATAQAGVAWVGDEVVDIALGGKLFALGSLLRSRFETTMSSSIRDVRIRSADASGLTGAMNLGITDGAERYGVLVHRWRFR
ncbi:BadF/BadG/BcrA/BcrD ATPase family protein [Amycolatopsis sp. GM8]|uniref:N-acetylglucosamine kinase n=1 Tax=Amycolatopsis sp. GM8 TaxID=2896530 RepID=UPI001F3D7B71|nr:BadF/BadG/BcrA/BcrD ATPase family protein [Amycolatopsis sp. GM8]